MSQRTKPLYRHVGGAMLRAAALPLDTMPTAWPALSDVEDCRAWLGTAWALPGFADAARYASGTFAGRVDAVLGGQISDLKQVRRVTLSVVRYLLRMAGRPTPFGLFAGVAAVHVGAEVQVAWGAGHRAAVRADTLWLDDVLERLETRPTVLRALRVVVSNLISERGDRIEIPRGPGRVTVRNTAVLRLIRDAAANPISVVTLSDKLTGAVPAAPATAIQDVLTKLVTQGVLITDLRPPMTVTDPLTHVLETLERIADPAADAEVTGIVGDLHAVRQLLDAHNAAGVSPDVQARLRDALTARMRGLSVAGRTVLSGDLHLDCRITVPQALATEMAGAVTALVRLTRQPRPDPAWNTWCGEFCNRYGIGAVVPVTEAVHPDAGLGLPAGFPGSLWAPPENTVSARDGHLLRLAWATVADGGTEVVLTDEVIAAITADTPVDPRFIAAHLELGARVHATSRQAVRDGDYTFTVHPAQAFGTLTGRFGSAVTDAGLDAVYAHTPPGVDGALSVQLSFPPLFPHSENVARVPAYLPYVLPLGEHRPPDGDHIIELADVGIVAAPDGLHLMSISRRRILDPQVFHALALQKQAPPLARFLATLTRAFAARYTEFDWGIPAGSLPYLPRVRYRRAILSPATWRTTAADVPALTAADGVWGSALTRWQHRWTCPDTVELHDEHRSLRLTLTAAAHRSVLREHVHKHGAARLTEAEPATAMQWIDGHVHETVMPFERATAPTPNLVTGSLPVTTNATAVHRPASPQSGWLYAQVFTHPDRLDDLIGVHLPHLLAALPGSPDGELASWFARYRSAHETDHLRLRVSTTCQGGYAAVATAVGAWGQQLSDTGVTSHLALATYRPEYGRYGTGPAMNAAEAVFAADSRAVVQGLHHLPASVISPMALAAASMVDLVDAFHPDPSTATAWLIDHLAGKTTGPADRDVAGAAIRWVVHRTLPDGASIPVPVAAAWQDRRTAAAAYRGCLPPDADHGRVLAALLHMHHNRARRIDRDDEAACLRLARQLAVTRQSRTDGGAA